MACACNLPIFRQFKKAYISLTKNITKQMRTEIYDLSYIAASVHRTMRTISFAA